jgi:hypothetical protein
MADNREIEESIFTRLIKGKCQFDDKKKQYIFPLKNKDSFICQKVIYIADPAYDSTFKMLFDSNGQEKTLMEFLNYFLFPDEDEDEDEDENDKINNVTYLVDEFPVFNKKHNKGMIITDVACKIRTKKKNNMSYV